ncbi:MAG: dihydrodipicolinate synthase family protein [Gemmatimonadales bacterium]
MLAAEWLAWAAREYLVSNLKQFEEIYDRRGCGTALVTPMRWMAARPAALRQLVEWQITEGIDFLVACGSTGEAQTLTPEERRTVVGTVVEVARGRVPVVAGATDNDTSRAVAETQAMGDLGVDGILSAAPFYNKPTQGGLLRHYHGCTGVPGAG